MSKPKTALIFLAPGAEEIEFVISVNVLRRAGIKVTVAGLTNEPIKCRRDMKFQPEVLLKDVTGPFDVIILPGGLEGAKALSDNALVGKLLKSQEASGNLIAAICVGPTVLKTHKIGLGKRITSYPEVKKEFEGANYKYVEEGVVVDGNIITSRGPGTAFDFVLKIVNLVVGKEKADEVAKGMLLL